jgi:hypothetical protein
MRWGGDPGHVQTGFREHCRDAVGTQAGDLIETVQHCRERGDHLLDAASTAAMSAPASSIRATLVACSTRQLGTSESTA